MLTNTAFGDIVEDVFGSRAIVRAIVTAVLDDQSTLAFPGWAGTSSAYYDRVARHIETDDPEMHRAIAVVVNAIRSRYRTHREHEHHVSMVPLAKCQDEIVQHRLDEDCCVCHMPLRGISRVSRIKPLDPADTCGHFIHAACLAKVRPDNNGHVHCPLCRADAGTRPLSTYADFENAIPEF